MIALRPLFATLLILACRPAFAEPLTAAETAQVDRLVTTTLAETQTPSASIAIVRGGRIVFARAYGKQSETRAAPRDDAPYQIASISKQFTAAALLLLEDDGKLSLDDPVAKYLPGIGGDRAITLRQLLGHTSGLRDYWPQDYSFKAMATPVTPEQIADRWAKRPTDFAPGTQWQYSNTGYVAAGMIVEQITGQSLLAFLDARIFTPLGIKAIDQDLAIGADYPQGYARAALGPVRPAVPAAHGWLFAAGELSMSARDLAKWNVARLERRILPSADWVAQETALKLPDGSSTGYGLGVSVGTANGRRFIEHNGEAVGFLSENIVYPEEGAAITVLTNSWSSPAFKAIAAGIAAIVLPAATMADATTTAKARALFDQLRRGRPDRTLLTDDADYYFTAQTVADFRDSLSPLGAPLSFELLGQPSRRGGFVNRTYRVTYADTALAVSTYTEPGDAGRFEQFLVASAQK